MAVYRPLINNNIIIYDFNHGELLPLGNTISIARRVWSTAP